MARQELLNTFAQVTLDATGAGTAQVAPPSFESWVVTTVAVHVSTNVSEPIAQVYVASADASNLIGATYTGSLDSSDGSWPVNPAQPILCAWTGGDAGAVATMSLYGSRYYTS